MILLIDNYDSFTYNLVQRLGEIDPSLDLEVHRNDQITLDEIAAQAAHAPDHFARACTPSEAGISCDAVTRFAGKLPILGVCLGHQSIGQASGGTIVRAKRLMHGKTDWIHHDNQGLFAGLDNPFQATRYHSLVIQPDTLQPRLRRLRLERRAGRLARDHGHSPQQYPLFGVQFHPESFLTHSRHASCWSGFWQAAHRAMVWPRPRRRSPALDAQRRRSLERWCWRRPSRACAVELPRDALGPGAGRRCGQRRRFAAARQVDRRWLRGSAADLAGGDRASSKCSKKSPPAACRRSAVAPGPAARIMTGAPIPRGRRRGDGRTVRS